MIIAQLQVSNTSDHLGSIATEILGGGNLIQFIFDYGLTHTIVTLPSLER
jgi:hypothetical protein